MKKERTPKECESCKHHIFITDYIRPYHFCREINKSFSGGEPKTFFECGKLKQQFQAEF